MDSPPIPFCLKNLLLLGTGDCLNFKKLLPIKERCDLDILPEIIVAEKVFIVLSYLPPNMSNDEFAQYR